MGAQNSSFKRCISDEFQRLQKEGRDFLVGLPLIRATPPHSATCRRRPLVPPLSMQVLDELIQLKLPRSQWSINLKSLSVLFVIDK